MFAVVTVHSKRPIDSPTLFKNVIPVGSLDEAYAKTRLAATPETKKSVVYWKINVTTVALVLQDGANGLETHVENYIGASSVSNLKREAENTLRILKDAARAQRLVFDDVRIRVYAEDHSIQEGKPVGFWGFLWKQFLDKMLTTFLISIGAGIVGLLTSKEPLVAVWSFLGVLGALLLRIIVESVQFKREITYADT